MCDVPGLGTGNDRRCVYRGARRIVGHDGASRNEACRERETGKPEPYLLLLRRAVEGPASAAR